MLNRNLDHLKEGIKFEEMKELTDQFKIDIKSIIEQYLFQTGLHVSSDRLTIEFDIENEELNLKLNDDTSAIRDILRGKEEIENGGGHEVAIENLWKDNSENSNKTK